jgi:hypothetical protein
MPERRTSMAEDGKPKIQQPKRPKVENLQLNKETIRDLSEQESEQAKGGRAVQASAACDPCSNILSGC